ncbi:MAG: B12-binding domain-containing radical SAM protein [Promethearchaeota archaeon]
MEARSSFLTWFISSSFIAYSNLEIHYLAWCYELNHVVELWTPPCILLYKNLGKATARSPPLGLAYVASYLEQNGFKDRVKIYDSFAMGYTWSDIEHIVRESPAKYFGITCLTATLREVSLIAKLIKKHHPRKIVIVGGVHPTSAPRLTLQKHPEIDYLILGEGEITFRDLLRILDGKGDEEEKKKSISNLKGVAFRNVSNEVVTSYPQFIENVDDLPFPAYHLLPMEKYCPSAKFPRYSRYGAIISARGCPYNCSFCAARVVCGMKIRERTVSSVKKELDLLKERYHIRQVEILDSTFTNNAIRAKKIALELKRRNIKWLCNGRVNEVDLKMLRFFHNCGCEVIEFGFESADLKTLKKMKKNISVSQMKNTIQWAHDAQLMVSGAFMIGNLGDTPSSIRKTLTFVLKQPLDFFSLAIFTPYPGTRAYEEAREKGLIDASFENYESPKQTRPVIHLETISSKKLKQYWLLLTTRFYLRLRFVFRFARNLARNPRMIKMIFPFIYGITREFLGILPD